MKDPYENLLRINNTMFDQKFRMTKKKTIRDLAAPFDPETKKITEKDITYNPKSNKKFRRIATSSRFHSDAKLVEDIIKNNIERSKQFEPKILPECTVVLTEEQNIVSDRTKAAILSRKYRRYHFMLNVFSKKKFLSDKQIAYVFLLVKQVKEVLKKDEGSLKTNE